MDSFFQKIFHRIHEQAYNPCILKNERSNDDKRKIRQNIQRLINAKNMQSNYNDIERRDFNNNNKYRNERNKNNTKTKKNNDTICSICLEEIQKNKKKKLYCHHCFHRNCINQWIKLHNNTCLQCRSSIK